MLGPEVGPESPDADASRPRWLVGVPRAAAAPPPPTPPGVEAERCTAGSATSSRSDRGVNGVYLKLREKRGPELHPRDARARARSRGQEAAYVGYTTPRGSPHFSNAA